MAANSDKNLNRCILIFPTLPNAGVIDAIRDKFDPAAGLVRPHITLVFPFVSLLGAEEIAAHMRGALRGIEPFALSLQGISTQRSFGNYLILNVHTGKNTIKEMHRRLYTGVLEQYKPLWCRAFEPHMTVGRVEDGALLAQAACETERVRECFETCVSEVCVEIIGDDGGSSIESVVPLPVP